MTEYTRTINIRSFNLGAPDTTFILTFDSEKIPDIFKDVYPTAWKVTEFPKSGGYMFKATYKSQLGVSRAQVDGGIIQPAETYIPINVGHQTTLSKKRLAYFFSEPVPTSKKDQLVAINGTEDPESIGVGFFSRSVELPPSTLLYFKNVGAGSSVQAKFHPILRGYVTSDYQENGVLTGQVSSPVLFEEDLTLLPKESYWKITYNPGSKKYNIVPDPEYEDFLKKSGYKVDHDD